MIFVTLGTQDKSFQRLLTAIENRIKDGKIRDKVVVQAGYTQYQSEYMEIFDYMEKEDFERFMAGCDLLITHGGVGSIMTGLKSGKKIIAAARLAKYGEHTNDHQLQIIEKFEKLGYLIALTEFDQVDQAMEAALTLPRKEYKSNTKNVIAFLEDYIDTV